MCWGQSRRQRTVATPCSDGNRDESRTRGRGKSAGITVPNEPEENPTYAGATATEQPGGKPFPLDKPFQERSDTPRAMGPTRAKLRPSEHVTVPGSNR